MSCVEFGQLPYHQSGPTPVLATPFLPEPPPPSGQAVFTWPRRIRVPLKTRTKVGDRAKDNASLVSVQDF